MTLIEAEALVDKTYKAYNQAVRVKDLVLNLNKYTSWLESTKIALAVELADAEDA